MQHIATKTFTVSSGQSASETLSRGSFFDNASSLCVMSPSSLTSSAFTFQVSVDGSTWFDLQSGGSDVTIAAGKAVTITPPPVRYLRLSGDQSEGSDRTFNLSVMVNSGV